MNACCPIHKNEILRRMMIQVKGHGYNRTDYVWCQKCKKPLKFEVKVIPF